jgi:hypothetical protein
MLVSSISPRDQPEIQLERMERNTYRGKFQNPKMILFQQHGWNNGFERLESRSKGVPLLNGECPLSHVVALPR